MSSLDKISNVVVLMLENGSFDHKLGFLRSADYQINGLDGSESVPVDPADARSPEIRVSDDASYRGDFDLDADDPADKTFIDPNHEFTSVQEQLFRGSLDGKPTNKGFIFDYQQQKTAKGGKPNTPQHAQNIVKCFAPQKLPVLTTLAKEFAVCDRWFSSVPGPTWPNRLFVHAATSAGHLDNSLHKEDYNIDTIYDRFETANLSWHIYFHDLPQSLALVHLQKDLVSKYRLFHHFLADARKGTLPAYSFIEPRYSDFLSLKANDQHPPHDVALGEHLIADVYEAIRNSPQWEQTLLVILADEHGGIYDHVPPPETVNPDSQESQDPPFDFKRLGLRVPAILVSPYIEKGTIDNTQDYDHTSLLATVEKRFNLRPLTRRDAGANTFEGVLSLSAPRADAPLTVPRPQDAIAQADYSESSKRLAELGPQSVKAALDAKQFAAGAASEFQISLVRLTKNLALPDEDAVSQVLRLSRWADTEHDVAEQIRKFSTRLFGHLF